MKNIFKRMLALGLSLCLLLCVPVAASAEDEDLLSYYNGDEVEYYLFLYDYFTKRYETEGYYQYFSSAWIDLAVGQEMARLFNLQNNELTHPYLRGIIEENGEITITGLLAEGYHSNPVFIKFLIQENMLDEYYKADRWYYKSISEIVIPDEIDGFPVTRIQDGAFDGGQHAGNEDRWLYEFVQSVSVGNNVREIGDFAFSGLSNVQTLHLGNAVRTIEENAFDWIGAESRNPVNLSPFPESLETIGADAFCNARLPEIIQIPPNVQTLSCSAFHDCYATSLVLLNNGIEITDGRHGEIENNRFFDPYETNRSLYCYTGSTAEAFAKEYGDAYQLINGDSLLWDGETIAGNVLPVRFGMTEEELRSHLSVDGTSSEIQIDGLQDGKVTGGTTITLSHTVAQAPGKVYTVEKKAEPVSVSVETLPTKTNYFYKETFDPSGLSLRVAYDDGTETVVTDGVACTGTDLKIGTNTITATYENCSTTFTVTVRLPQAVRVSVETLPTKTNYFYKEAFDPSGLSLRVTYDDGTETVVTDGIACTGTDLIVGTNTITATYENCSTTFTVTVRLPQAVRVSVETLPTKTNYFYKEAFDPSGLSLRVTYDDGTETVVTDGVACTGTDLKIGTNTITATVENQSVTFPVTVRYSWWQTLIRIFLFGFLWY